MGDQDPKPKSNKGKDKVPEPEGMDSVYARWSRGLARQYGSWDGNRNLSVGASGSGAPRNPGPSGPANPGQNAPPSAPVTNPNPNQPPHGPPEGQPLAAAPGGSSSSHGVDRRGRQRKAAPASRKKATTATAKEPSARRAGTAKTRTKRVRAAADKSGQNAPPSAPVVRKPRGRPRGKQHGEASREPLAVQNLAQPQPSPAPDLDADNEIGWCWGCGLRPADMRPQPLMHVCACDTCRLAVCWFCDPDQQAFLLQHGDDVPQLLNQPVVANCPVEQHGEAPAVQLGHPGLPPPPQAHPVLPADQPVASPGPVPVPNPDNEFGWCRGCRVRPARMLLQPRRHVCACNTCCFVVCEVCRHDL